MYVHENNLIGKIKNDYKGKGEYIKTFSQDVYFKYREALGDIDFMSGNISEFEKAAKLIDEYFEQLDDFSKSHKITHQSKFRPSFLEEISMYIFKDLFENEISELSIYNKGVYAGLKVSDDFNISIIKKDVDFCVGKKVSVKFDNKTAIDIIVPIVAVEVKTYLDGTMFGEVQYSARQLKNATPNVKTFVIMEDNQVGIDKIMAAKYDNTIDEMFVFKGKSDRNFNAKVLLDYYNEVKISIENMAQEYKIQVPGRLLNIN